MPRKLVPIVQHQQISVKPKLLRNNQRKIPFLGTARTACGLRDTNRLAEDEFIATKKALLYLLINVVGQIERLGALRDHGILTDDEFKRKKIELLSHM